MLYLFGFADMGRQRAGWIIQILLHLHVMLRLPIFLSVLPCSCIRFKKLAWLLAVFILFAGLLVTGSRSALISFALSILMILLYQFNWKQTFVKTGLYCDTALLLSLIIDFNRLADAIPAWESIGDFIW